MCPCRKRERVSDRFPLFDQVQHAKPPFRFCRKSGILKKRPPQSGNLIKGTQNHLQTQTVMMSYEIPFSSSIFIPAKVHEIALRSLNQIKSHQIPIQFPLFPCDNVQGFAGVRRTAQSTARGAKKYDGGTPGAPHGKHAILTAENDGKNHHDHHVIAE